VTNAGDSLYAVSAMWLVYSLTGSTFYTGVAGFLTLGMQALQAFVGPLVDRWPLRRTLVWTQAVQAVLVLTVPVAHVTGYLSVWLVLAVMPLLSLLNQFVYPAGTAALPRIVDEEELTAANSLFATTYQGSELVFNALAGVLVTAVGAVTLFAVDSVTFAVAVALFAGLRVPPADRDAATDQTPAASASRGSSCTSRACRRSAGCRPSPQSTPRWTDSAAGTPASRSEFEHEAKSSALVGVV
jgi:MFS family permease